MVIFGTLSAWSAWGQAAQTIEPKPEQTQEQIKQLSALAAGAQEAPVVHANRDGFWFKSANGDFQLKAGGYMHSGGRFYPSDPGNQATRTFVLRRVRPSLQGTPDRFIDFRLMPDFGEGKAGRQDAYLELRNRDLGIQLSGDLAKNRLNHAIGVFNGTPEGGSVDGDTNDGKDYVAGSRVSSEGTGRGTSI